MSCFTVSNNLGLKVGDKLTKLIKIGFPMESFTAAFLRLFTKTCQNLTFGWTAGHSLSLGFQGFSGNFLIS